MSDDRKLGVRIFLSGIVILAGASPLIACGITEWQKEQDIIQAHFKQMNSSEMKKAIDEARR